MPPMTKGLPAKAAEKALAAAEAAGIEPRRLLCLAGIDEAPDELSFAELCELYEQAALLTGDDAFGLHVGERTSARMYGRLGYVAANCPTFGAALNGLVEFQGLWTKAVGLELLERRGTAVLRYWHKDRLEPERRRQESEQMLAALLTFARSVLDLPLRPKQVRFEHRRPADVAEYKRIFGCPLVFGARHNDLMFTPETLALPLPSADPVLGRLMAEEAESALARQRRGEPLLDRLRGRLEAAMLEGRPVSLTALASEADLTPRTLQRRLRSSGLTFRRLVEEARLAAATNLLERPDLALGQIAFRLGFSQPSAFHRTFRRKGRRRRNWTSEDNT